MPLADPERFGTAPTPPPALGERVMAAVGAEQRSSPAPPHAPRPGAERATRRGRGGPGDLRPAGRWREHTRAARQLRVAAGEDEDRRHPRAARLRHRDPRLRQGRALGRALPRLPARPRAAPACLPAPSATAGGTTRNAVLSSALDLSRTAAIGIRVGEAHLRSAGQPARRHSIRPDGHRRPTALPHVDELSATVDADAEATWDAMLRVTEGSFASRPAARVGRTAGRLRRHRAPAAPARSTPARAFPGFHVESAEPHRELALCRQPPFLRTTR